MLLRLNRRCYRRPSPFSSSAAATSSLRRLRRTAPLPAPTDAFTLISILRACSSTGGAGATSAAAAHCQAIISGFHTHTHIANELILMYGKLGRMDTALQLFDTMPVKTVISWNIMLSGYSLNHNADHAYDMFLRMDGAGVEPNGVTWTALLSAHSRCGREHKVVQLFGEMRRRGCGGTAEAVAVVLSALPHSALRTGVEIHGFIVRNGFEGYPFVRNALVGVYGKMGKREDADRLFSEIDVKDLVSWNALISGYANVGLCDEASEVFARMESAGRVANLVSWCAVIKGYATAGMEEKSLEFFRQMQRAGIPANSITVTTVLSACAELSALLLGREIHGHVIRGLMNGNILVGNGLVNMYTKSGSLRAGRMVFDRIEGKDCITWNSMIDGYGMHGHCDGALITFNTMVIAGFKPDGITYLTVLSACSHVGRVSEGRCLFNRMINEFNLVPSLEHYSCMVDLLGRAGMLREASELIESMPMKPDACVWGALLNSCRLHGNTAIADEILRRIDYLEEKSTGNYILLSNLYAASGRWEDSAGVRVLTKAKGLKKNPGRSWITVKEIMHVFSAGSSFPRGAEEAYGVLEDLNNHMESEKRMPEDWRMLDNYNIFEEGDGCMFIRSCF